MRLSADYGKAADDLADILEVKAKAWETIRAGVKTDTQAERKWDSGDLGVKEMRLRLTLKKLEKQMSAIRTHIEVKTGEARNLY